MGSYGSWWISFDGKSAWRENPALNISLEQSNVSDIELEGWWKERPRRVQTVISGSCLWGADWEIMCRRKTKIKHQPNRYRRSLGLPREREELFGFLNDGFEVTQIHLPLQTGIYHKLLIRWLSVKFSELAPEQILFHLPRSEYHVYIDRIAQWVKPELLYRLHDELETFATIVEVELMKNVADVGICGDRITIIDPSAVQGNPNGSFLLPYTNPETFGVSPDGIVGVEDLAELRLAYEAHKRTRRSTPVLCGVLKMPHPHLEKDRSNTCDPSKILSLES